MTEIITGNIDSAFKNAFRANFYSLASQTQSYLAQSPGVVNGDFEGATERITRGGTTEMREVEGRNPEARWKEYQFDARWKSYKTYSDEFIVDKRDAMKMIADPKSFIWSKMMEGYNRLKDRVVIAAAIGDVKVGAYWGATDTKTATQDGVMNLDATATGFTYETFLKLQRNFGNRYQQVGQLTIATTINEQTKLETDDRFINALYTPATGGAARPLGNYIIPFAGSDLAVGGVGKIINPILPEIGTTRTNIVFANAAVETYIKGIHMEFFDSLQTHPLSSGLFLAVELGGIRLEGSKIHTVTTSIADEITN
jgi:hypothetical protein